MDFFQDGPRLGNQYDEDGLLREYLERTLPRDVHAALEPELREMGALTATTLFDLAMASRGEEPRLVHFDPWGRRVDAIVVPEAWKTFGRVAAEWGLVAIPYEQAHGPASRLHQFALVHLYGPSSCVYTCPLAMSDGAAATLRAHRNEPLLARAFPRLTSRDPRAAWTSGQWMTERTGGSDVGRSLTVARKTEAGWRLSGTKWFTSATTAEMTLTLARPEGAGSGGKGLALFYLELRDATGALNGIRILRLKDKLGTRMLPTAELELDDALAVPVTDLSDGVRAIAPMLQVTRSWNAACAVGSIRRGLALARSYARRRVAFGAALADKPAHIETLAALQVEYETCFLLTFRVAELLGRVEAGTADPGDGQLLRMLQPLVKLFTGKRAVSVCSEVLEAFGGAGYVEDTGLPALLRDAQVLSIWEGTTNVLALDLLRALNAEDGWALLAEEIRGQANLATAPALRSARSGVLERVDEVGAWLASALRAGPAVLEGGARSFAESVASALGAALVLAHAQWLLDARGDRRGLAVAARLTARLPGMAGLPSPEETRRVAFPDP